MAVRTISFEDAMREADSVTPNLLLGNGFSMQPHPELSYRSLAQVAKKLDPSIKPLLEDETNFEKVMASVFPHERDRLRSCFIETISHVHGRRDRLLTDEQLAFCCKFLHRFLRRRKYPRPRGLLFTTNYDLLIFWAVVEEARIGYCKDGFNDHKSAMWYPQSDDQIFYLHGALHIFDEGASTCGRPMISRMRARKGLSLIESVKRRIASGDMPLFVSEGTSEEKLARIRKSPYLQAALMRFEDACRQADRPLFVYGHSLSDVDIHIRRAITEGNLSRLYVSYHDKDALERLRYTASEIMTARSPSRPIDIAAFDSSTAKVWGSADD